LKLIVGTALFTIGAVAGADLFLLRPVGAALEIF
jgi:hypothetical protein